MFLNDIVEQRLGTRVTADEFAKLADLTTELKAINKEINPRDYANKLVEINNYMKSVKKDYVPTNMADMARHYALEGIALGRSIMTSIFDVSATFRQARALFGTKQWTNAFSRLPAYLKSQEGLNVLEADMLSSKHADKLMKYKDDLGLTLFGDSFTTREESFASKLSDKIAPIAMSNRAYVGFLNDVRFHRFVDIIEQKAKAGVELNDAQLKELAKVISASTGRGSLPPGFGTAASTVLFSPRFMASRLQTYTNVLTKKGVAREEAAKSLARLVGTSVAMLALAKMSGADVETDMRSADFGKFRVGNNRFDMTGGMAPYIVFLARFKTQQTKSSTTGKVNDLGVGWGKQTTADLLNAFISSKASPVAGVIRDYLKGETFSGEPLGIKESLGQNAKVIATNLFTPLIAKDAYDAFTEGAGGQDVVSALLATGANVVGIGFGSYEATPRGEMWKELKKQDSGKYKEALNEYRDNLETKLATLKSTNTYENAPETGKNSKASMITKIDSGLKKNIIKKYRLSSVE